MLPVDYEFGYVVGRAVLAAPDGTDADRFPDGKSVTGKAIFKPSVDARVTDNYSALVLTPTYEAEFYRPLVPGLDLFPPGTLVDAQKKEGIWLPVGVYTVSLQIKEATVNAFQIEVTTAHTEAAPLDLFQAAPPMPGSGVVFVTVQVPAGGSPTETLVRATDGQLVWSPVPEGPEGPEGPQGLPGVNAVPGDEAVAGWIGTEGSSASQDAVDARVLKTVTEDGPVKEALSGSISDQVMVTTTSVAARVDRALDENLAGTVGQFPPHSRRAVLVDGRAGETPTQFSGSTVVADAGIHLGSGRGWRMTRVTEGANLVRADFAIATLTPGPVSAVTLRVFVPLDTQLVSLTAYISGAGGSWQRYSGQSGTNISSFKPGWNTLRVESRASAWQNLTGITSVSVRGTVGGVGQSIVIGDFFLETPEKANALFVCDWGSAQFRDNMLPEMRARNWHPYWALRAARVGDSTAAPNDHVTWGDVAAFKAAGDSIGIHSLDGSPTSGMTAPQLRDEYTQALAILREHGYPAPIWRGAWVQNIAPAAPELKALQLLSAGYADSYGPNPWPPINRYNIIRLAIYASTASMDNAFATMEANRYSTIFYAHGVTETGDANHASFAQRDYFLGKIDAAVAAGWLRLTDMETLIQESGGFDASDAWGNRTAGFVDEWGTPRTVRLP